MNVKPKEGAIVVGVSSIEKAKAFYFNAFEVTIKEQSENYLLCDFNGVDFEIEEDSPNRFPNWVQHNLGTYKPIEIEVSDIVPFTQKVINYGGSVLHEIVKRPWGSISTEITDVDGNIWHVAQKES